MAEATPRTFFSGASLVWSRQRVLWLIYIVNFVLAYFATRGTNERIAAILDHSLAAGQLVHGFNLGALASLAANPESPFGGSISASLSGAILFTVFMIFATGGILATYYSGQRLHAGAFFEACGHHFWRFVRLTIYLLIVLIPVVILGGIAHHVFDRVDKQSISPMPAVHFFEAAAVVVLLLLICIRVWFDMAQVIAVAEDERRMHKALRRSATLLRAEFSFSLLAISAGKFDRLDRFRYRFAHLDDTSASRIYSRSVPAFSIPDHLLASMPLMAARE